MLKKSITYTDFNGVEYTEDFYFNLTKSEILKLEISTPGGYSAMIQDIINAKDMPTLMSIFDKFILESYGKKSPDGKRFIKSKEMSDEFAQTEAYNVLFMELCSDAKAAADFINGIIPSDMQERVKQEQMKFIKSAE